MTYLVDLLAASSMEQIERDGAHDPMALLDMVMAKIPPADHEAIVRLTVGGIIASRPDDRSTS